MLVLRSALEELKCKLYIANKTNYPLDLELLNPSLAEIGYTLPLQTV